MRRLIVLVIILISLALSAKVIYEFRSDDNSIKLKSQKTKSSVNLQKHKENYFKLVEKLGLNYIIDWKSGVDKNGDTVKYFDNILYADKINLKKLIELKKLGLRYYNDIELSTSDIDVVRKNQISVFTLIYKILSMQFIFIGSVESSETPFYPSSSYNTKIVVKVDEFLKGSYYFEKVPMNLKVFCKYGRQLKPKDFFKPEDWGETELIIGKKYLFFARKSISSGSGRSDINNNDVFINDEMCIYFLENGIIKDRKWDFPEYIDTSKLREYIKLIDKTNETEKFYDIDFK